MEQFILNLFQEHLSKFIIGFRKDQVTANLLNGKGEITDVELNCSYINEMLRKVTPYIEFESVHLSKVSFHVHSWTNIRHSPIIIDLENVTIVILEPMQYDPEASRRTKVRQLTFQELIQLMKEGVISKPRSQASSYSLLDRIFDNLVIEARSISVTFQPMGIFKTRRVGPWTPPALLMQFFDVRWVNVNEYGQEESKNDVSRHHRKHHHSRRKDGTLLVYKKLEMEYQISLIVERSENTMSPATTNDNTDKDVDMNDLDRASSEKESTYKTVVPIISWSRDISTSGGPLTVHHHPYKKLEMQWTIKRRIRDGEYLAIQVDCMIPIIEIVLSDRSTLSHLIHFATALKFCLCKDRSFSDPLRPTGVSSPVPQNPIVVMSNEEESPMTSSTEDVTVGHSDGKESESSAALVLNLADGLSDSSDGDDDSNDSAVDDDVESDSVQRMQELIDSSVHTSLPEEERATTILSQATNLKEKSFQKVVSVVPSKVAHSSDRPLLVFSNGLIIHEKFSLSFSLHEIVIRANHTMAPGDGVELTMKGVVAEAIWPPMIKEKGGCVQASVAHLSIQERLSSRIRHLLVCGQKLDASEPLERLPIRSDESDQGKVFPIFQDRSIRPDPLGMRQKYPDHSIGVKLLVMLPKKSQGDGNDLRMDDWMIFPDVGLDRFDITLDTNPWCRLFRYASIIGDGEFDLRWWSGDYGEDIANDMLLHPNIKFSISDCLQISKHSVLDESFFPSSDRLKATIRITQFHFLIPGSPCNDIQSCDVHARLDEFIVKTSSELPRSFVNEVHPSQAAFPNDPSDVVFSLGNLETIDSCGQETNHIRTFRSQTSVRGLSIQLSPIVPVLISHEPEQLLLPSDITIVLCLEDRPRFGEQNSTCPRLLALTSIIVHRFVANIDLDVVAPALVTILFHCDVIKEYASFASFTSTNLDGSKAAVRNVFRDRIDRMRRHVSLAQKEGGIFVSLSLKMIDSGLCFWRQNIPRKPLLQPAPIGPLQIAPILKLIDFRLNSISVSIEANEDDQYHCVVGKLSAMDLTIDLCDFQQCLDSDAYWFEAHSNLKFSSATYHANSKLIKYVSFKGSDENRRSIDARVDYRRDKLGSLSFAVDFCDGLVDCRVDLVENILFLLIDALSAPCHFPRSEESDGGTGVQRFVFPYGTVGYVFAFMAPQLQSSDNRSTVHCVTENYTNEFFSLPRLSTKMRTMFSKLTLSNIDILLIRAGIAKVNVQVSDLSMHSGRFEVRVADCNLLIGYVDTEVFKDARIFDVIGRKQQTWSTLFLNANEGLCHSVKSKQSVVYVKPCLESDDEYREENIVDEFGFNYSYNNSKLHFDVTDEISMANSIKMEQFFVALLCPLRRLMELPPKVSKRLKFISSTKKEISFGDSIGAQSQSMSLACMSSLQSLGFLEDFFRKIKHNANALCDTSKSALLDKDKEIADLRMKVFLKEKERLGTFALFCSEATGWLRMGRGERSGLRGVMSCMLWPHWVVLRRSLLLVYTSPGQHEIVDFISLEGAAIREIDGGNRKRDLKRAFAVIESSGTVHILITGSESEFVIWVESIERAIRLYSSDFSSTGDATNGPPVSLSSTQYNDAASSAEDSTHPDRPLGRSLAKVVNAAKVKGQVVARGMRNSFQSEVSDTKDFHGDGTEGFPNPGVHQIRNRFAGVSKATKNRLGSAIAAAKQKGKDAVLRRQGASVSDWACVQCTYINSGKIWECQICGSIRPTSSGDQVDLTPDSLIQFQGSSVTEQRTTGVTGPIIIEDDVERHGSQVSIKYRFESVVRRARTATLDGSRPVKLNPLLRDQQEGLGALKAQKLNNITLGRPILSPIEVAPCSKGQELPLKQLGGTWIVKVELPPHLSLDADPCANDPPSNVGNNDEHFRDTENVEGNYPSTGTLAGSSGQSDSDEGDQFVDLTFKINASKYDGDVKPSECVDLVRTLSEIAALYTILSESVARAPTLSFNQGLQRKPEGSLDVSTIECMITTGRLLGALIERPPLNEVNGESVRSFYGVVVSEFLNNVVNSPLPIDALACVVDFFQLSDSSANSHTIERTPFIGRTRQVFSPHSELNAIDAKVSEFYKVLTLCETEYMNSKQQGAIALRLAEKHLSSSVDSAKLSLAEAGNPGSSIAPSFRFSNAVFTALNRVMEERDSAHCKLVSAEVLHRVELDEQRKSLSEQFEKRLAEANEATVSTTPAEKKGESSVAPNRQESHVHRDADSELLSLCQQLAGEISARAAADMEVVRLKEARKMEQEIEAAEKSSLQKELALAREQLQRQNKKLEMALNDAQSWRESFEEVVKFRKGS